MEKKLNRRTWNTYALSGYTHQVGTDPQATGGVHLYEVRKSAHGWQKRITDSNGRFQSSGAYEAIGDIEGELLFERAKAY